MRTLSPKALALTVGFLMSTLPVMAGELVETWGGNPFGKKASAAAKMMGHRMARDMVPSSKPIQINNNERGKQSYVVTIEEEKERKLRAQKKIREEAEEKANEAFKKEQMEFFKEHYYEHFNESGGLSFLDKYPLKEYPLERYKWTTPVLQDSMDNPAVPGTYRNSCSPTIIDIFRYHRKSLHPDFQSLFSYENFRVYLQYVNDRLSLIPSPSSPLQGDKVKKPALDLVHDMENILAFNSGKSVEDLRDIAEKLEKEYHGANKGAIFRLNLDYIFKARLPVPLKK